MRCRIRYERFTIGFEIQNDFEYFKRASVQWYVREEDRQTVLRGKLHFFEDPVYISYRTFFHNFMADFVLRD